MLHVNPRRQTLPPDNRWRVERLGGAVADWRCGSERVPRWEMGQEAHSRWCRRGRMVLGVILYLPAFLLALLLHRLRRRTAAFNNRSSGP